MAKANGYLLQTEKIREDQKFRGQAALIHGFLKTSAPEPKTVADIVKAIEAELQTRQDPTRVVSFYMSVWKKKGWVKPVTVDAPEAEAAQDVSEEPMNSHDEGLGVTVDEQIAAKLEADVEATHIEGPSIGDIRVEINEDMKLSDIVNTVLRETNMRLNANQIASIIQQNGVDANEKRVRSAASHLFQRGAIHVENNEYFIVG